MIYAVGWPDGRRAIVRAQDEERARRRARGWREFDIERAPDATPNPNHIEAIQAKGPLAVIAYGWEGEFA